MKNPCVLLDMAAFSSNKCLVLLQLLVPPILATQQNGLANLVALDHCLNFLQSA